MAVDERLVRVLHLRPPRRVVAGLRLWLVGNRHAASRQVLERRLDGGHRIQRIASAVDDEERLVPEVAGKQLVLLRRVLQHQDVAVQRQEGRVGCRVEHADEVGPCSAVGNARQNDAVFVDVIRPLHRVEDAAQVVDLRVAPPRRVVPRGRQHVDLLGAGETADAGPPSPFVHVARRRDAAVQLDPDLIGMRGIVGRRHVQEIAEFSTVACDDPRRRVPVVRASALQSTVRVIERDAGPDDLRCGFARRRQDFWPTRTSRTQHRSCSRFGRRRPTWRTDPTTATSTGLTRSVYLA